MRRQIVLALLATTALSSPATAQLAQTHAGGAPGVTITPPCDLVACTFAIGPRKLRTGQTKALQAKRSSDSTTQDIGFVGGNLDEASLLSFCAATNCTANIWYDQSGNGHDMSLGNFNLVTAGAISARVNGHAVGAVGATYNLGNTGNFAYCTSTTCSFFGVAQIQSGSTTNCVNSSNMFGTTEFTPTYYIGVLSTANTACGGTNNTNANVSYTTSTNALFTLRYNSGDATKFKIYVNGGTPGTHNTAGAASITGGLELGCENGNASCAVPSGSRFMEWLVFSGEPSLADSNTLGNNQASYWGNGSGISWTTITQ